MLAHPNFIRASVAATATGNSGELQVSPGHAVAIEIDVTVVTGTSPQLIPSWERLGVDGVTWYPIWTGTAITAAGKVSQVIGRGWESAKFPGNKGRLVWTISGTTPSFTFSAGVVVLSGP